MDISKFTVEEVEKILRIAIRLDPTYSPDHEEVLSVGDDLIKVLYEVKEREREAL